MALDEEEDGRITDFAIRRSSFRSIRGDG